MFSLATLIIAVVIALVAGGLLGALLFKGLDPKQKESRTLEDRLQKAESQLKDYQQEVSEHFAETSQLVNNLTQSYRDVHEHLASGALRLTNPDISRQLIDAGKGTLMLAHPEGTDSDADQPQEPPRDWAPRDPESKGQLSEDFGLEPHQDKAEEEHEHEDDLPPPAPKPTA